MGHISIAIDGPSGAGKSTLARAQRRWKELQEKGQDVPYETVLRETKERDWADAHRAVAPLRPAEDAVVLDTSSLDLDESLEALVALVKGRTEP